MNGETVDQLRVQTGAFKLTLKGYQICAFFFFFFLSLLNFVRISVEPPRPRHLFFTENQDNVTIKPLNV